MSTQDYKSRVSRLSIEVLSEPAPLYIRLETRDHESAARAFREGIGGIAKAPLVVECVCEHGDHSPFAPFLQVVKDRNSALPAHDLQRLVTVADLYPPHRDILRDYIGGTVHLRPDDLQADEVEYERMRFCRDIETLLSMIGDANGVVVIVRNTETAGAATIDFLRYLEKRISRAGLGFVFLFSDTVSETTASSALFFSELTKAGRVQSLNDAQNARGAPSSQTSFRWSTEELIALYNFGCFSECAALSSDLIGRENQRGQKNGSEESLLLFRLASASNNFARISDPALADRYVALAKGGPGETRALLERARSKLAINGYEAAADDARECSALAAKQGLFKDQAEAELILFLCQNTTRTVFLEPQIYSETFYSLRTRLQSSGLENQLAFLSTDSIALMELYRNGRRDEAIRICEEGIDISARLGNELRLSYAYHSYALLLQADQRFSDAGIAYRKALSITNRIATPYERARLCNGFGYFYFSQGDFALAFNQYTQALDLLIPLRMPEELGTTLVNIAFCYVFSFNFDDAIRYLEATMSLMDASGLKDLPFHPRHYIQSLCGYSYVQAGQPDKSLRIIEAIENDSLFEAGKRLEYYFFFAAHLAWKKSQRDEASEYFIKALDAIDELYAETTHVRALFFLEHGRFLWSTGDKLGGSRKFEQVLKITKGNEHFDYFRNLALHLLKGTEEPTPLTLSAYNVDLESLLSLTQELPKIS